MMVFAISVRSCPIDWEAFEPLLCHPPKKDFLPLFSKTIPKVPSFSILACFLPNSLPKEIYMKKYLSVLLLILFCLPFSANALADIYDDFNDGILDSAKWDLPSALASNVYETNGELIFDFNASDLRRGGSLSSKDIVTGNFDIQINFDNYTFTAGPSGQSGGYAALSVLAPPAARSELGSLSIRRLDGPVTSTGSVYGSLAYYDDSLKDWQVDYNILPFNSNTGEFRVKRENGYLSTYVGYGDSWTQVFAGASAYEGPVTVYLEGIRPLDGGIHVEFDNLDIKQNLTDEASQHIYLDWDNPISRDFYVSNRVDENGNKSSFVNEMLGVEPLATRKDDTAFRADVAADLKKIFEAAGVKVSISETYEKDAITVRFTDALTYDPDGDGIFEEYKLSGKAYDIGVKDEDGNTLYGAVDKFNQRKDGEIGVFLSLDSIDSAKSIAETIAHEAGHAFGLMHINPIEGNGVEVMDYYPRYQNLIPNEIEEFYNQPAEIVHKPWDSDDPRAVLEREEMGDMHNPVYHMRRFVNGDESSDLIAQGISPGNWDLKSLETILLAFDRISSDMGIYNISILGLSGFGLKDYESQAEGKVFYDAISPFNNSILKFFVPTEFSFQLAGMSDPASDFYDVYFGFGDPMNPQLTWGDFQRDLFEGSIFTFSENSETFSSIGSFAAHAENRITYLNPDGASAAAVVPEPSTIFLFASGVLGFIVKRRIF